MPEHQESDSVSDNHEQHWPNVRTVSAPVWIIWSVCLFAAFAGLVAHYYVYEHSAKIKFFSDALLSFSALAVVITQAVIYSQQRDIMRQQQQMVAISQRAYIGIVDGKFVKPLIAGAQPELRTIFRNGGNTPAWHFRSHYRMVLSDKPLRELVREFPVEYKRKQAGAFIPAGQAKRVEVGFKFPITASQIVEISQKSRVLYVFIEVEFKDFQKTGSVILTASPITLRLKN